MIKLIPPGQARIPIGHVVVNGQQLDVFIDPEWARYFESLNKQTVASASTVTNINNSVAATMMGSDSGDSVEYMPIKGDKGERGDKGDPLYLLSDTSESVEYIPVKGEKGDKGEQGQALFFLNEPETNDVYWIIK